MPIGVRIQQAISLGPIGIDWQIVVANPGCEVGGSGIRIGVSEQAVSIHVEEFDCLAVIQIVQSSVEMERQRARVVGIIVEVQLQEAQATGPLESVHFDRCIHIKPGLSGINKESKSATDPDDEIHLKFDVSSQ